MHEWKLFIRRSRDLRIREVFNCDEPVREIRAVRRILPDLSKEQLNTSKIKSSQFPESFRFQTTL